MTQQTADAAVFISYSRRDYYFAESLTLHLLKQGIPAWLDVKDLTPGVFWERDLSAALEASACVVIIASAESMKSPNVRQETERAVKLGKRIIVVRFRGAGLPVELQQRELVDFRGAFAPALRDLVALLQTESKAADRIPRHALGRRSLRWPLWVLSVIVFLSVPTIAYLALADWTGGPSSNLLRLPVLLLMAFGLSWAVSLSYLQRRMGMTRLAASLAILCGIFALPVVRYLRSGAAGLSTEAAGFAQATVKHLAGVAVLATLPLFGLGLILLLRPDDILRWTPTGKAWNWYRTQCTSRVFARSEELPPLQPQPFFLLNDTADMAAAGRIRRSLIGAGWREAAESPSVKTVLLLTNRTGTEWLLQQEPRLTRDVLTIVATSICLPAQLDWLWQREWIDLRSWDVGLLHRKELVPQVPEAVTEPRFPAPVRFVNHLLCALAALAFVLISIGNPNLAESQGPMSLGENLALIGPACIVICCFELARRLLRRTISETTFLRGAWMGWIAVLILAAWVWHAGVVTPPVEVRSIPVAVFLLLFPVAMFRSGKRLAFWFPSPSSEHDRTSRNLTSKRNWRTFGWVCAYLMLWGGVLGMY